jgi:hypothetical protein
MKWSPNRILNSCLPHPNRRNASPVGGPHPFWQVCTQWIAIVNLQHSRLTGPTALLTTMFGVGGTLFKTTRYLANDNKVRTS